MKNDQKPNFGRVDLDFNVDVRAHISIDFDDLPNVDEGQFYGDITEAEEVLRELEKMTKCLKNAIAYAKSKRDRITNE